jgi:outer membrane protein assembly factor BamA
LSILIALILAGQPSFAEEVYQTVGRRFTFLPLTGFSSDDGIGGGFRLSLFDYDGETIPYARTFSLQGFFTSKGKWAHQFRADFPEILKGNRLEISVRYDKEETASFFGDLSEGDLLPFSEDERNFEQIDPFITVRLIRTLNAPWQIQFRVRTGKTYIKPKTPTNVIGILSPLGHDGGMLLQAGVAVRYDTRDDYVNTIRGRLGEAGVEWRFGDGGNFNSIELTIEHRHFKEVLNRVILAQRLHGIYTFGDIPFYERPKLGSSKTLRGLSADRFRDDGRILMNTELRWLGVRASHRNNIYAGANLFSDIGQVFPRRSWPKSDQWEVGVGVGLRIYWHSTVVRADYGCANGGSALYMRFSQIF